MMMKLYAYARLILFMAGVLFGIQIPGFLDAYGKSLEFRLQESMRSLALFQKDADRYFEGDLGRLIDHYDKTGDPVFQDGGGNIAAISARKNLLEKALIDFRKSRFNAICHVLLRPVKDVRDSVFETYTHVIRLDTDAVFAGLAAGLVTALFLEMLLSVFLILFRKTLKISKKKG
ncbi:DUF2937 family protein [Desulfobotulus mexicanus]|uniref:DUF2937 family protein n=1 Tax=Desulfobotulus mexicanus TaxID=2586642 RepID=A0A5Q4VDL0_9BACT|nr:DUF2937 family protein [Desulfobotulus mexicanus]TYT75016.1 DUF2937 family protein [Desulfobotulus mexicanus]